MELSDVLRAPVERRMSARGVGITKQARRPMRTVAAWVAALSIVAALPLLPPGKVAAQQGATPQRPGITQLTAPEPDTDTTRREAADERVAAFLIAEAREELELGELRSARKRLEILVTRYASTSVAARARRLLEQLAMIDGYPIPPMPKAAAPIEAQRASQPASGTLTARPPGTSLLEADFSASGGDRLFFAEGSDEVGGRGLRILRDKAEWLQRHAKVFVRIEGHADDLGGDDINSALALRRAETVRDALVDAGVPATRMHIAAFGRENRISPCSMPSCAAQNRRAILVLTDARGTRLSAAQKPIATETASTPAQQAPSRTGPVLRKDR
jgi:peptidoglycan-associated lipoprotein